MVAAYFRTLQWRVSQKPASMTAQIQTGFYRLRLLSRFSRFLTPRMCWPCGLVSDQPFGATCCLYVQSHKRPHCTASHPRKQIFSMKETLSDAFIGPPQVECCNYKFYEKTLQGTAHLANSQSSRPEAAVTSSCLNLHLVLWHYGCTSFNIPTSS